VFGYLLRTPESLCWKRHLKRCRIHGPRSCLRFWETYLRIYCYVKVGLNFMPVHGVQCNTEHNPLAGRGFTVQDVSGLDCPSFQVTDCLCTDRFAAASLFWYYADMWEQTREYLMLSYGLDDPGIESRWGRNFPHPSRPAPGVTQPPIQWILGLFPWGKAARVWRSPPLRLAPRLKKE
jgi:hypothetical protein